MKTVITYGTYDLLHHGHIALLKRAKALGDYLIVGVTADGFDKERGKLNVQQSLAERIESVRNTGIADLIIVEEYEGTMEDPIPYTPPMEIYEGKYYTHLGMLYKCTRDSGTALTHNLFDLRGLYVELIE